MMSSTLFMLAKNQQTQNKLRKFIRQILSKYDGKQTYEAIMEMEYLDAVINGESKTLRLFFVFLNSI